MTSVVDKPELTQFKAAVDATSTSDELAAQFHDYMVGKSVLITGVSPSGLGAEAARVVAAHEPKLLILASRSPAAIEQVIANLKADASFDAAKTTIEALKLDLASQESVRAAAASLTASHPDLVLDVIINNAGIMMLQTYEGVPDASGKNIEKQFGTNHIGHFLFTNLLVPALRRSTATGGARVVSVTSRGYLGSPVKALDDASLLDDSEANHKAYDAFAAYAQSKTANLLFTVGLSQKLAGKGVVAYSVDPGAVGTTSLSRNVPAEVQKALGWRLEDGTINPAAPFISAQQSVASYIKAAYDPELASQSGATITSAVVDTGILDYAKDPELAAKLWTLSEKLVGEKFEY